MSYFCVTDTCDGATKVMQTLGIHRRRKCLVCGTLFLTEEVQYVLGRDERNPFTVGSEERKADAKGRQG